MDTLRSLHHLHAAYVLTWCVHLAYVLYLVRGFLEIRKDTEDLQKQ